MSVDWHTPPHPFALFGLQRHSEMNALIAEKRTWVEWTERSTNRFSPWIVLRGLIILWSAVLNANRRFAIAAFSPVTTSVDNAFVLALEAGSVATLAFGKPSGNEI